MPVLSVTIYSSKIMMKLKKLRETIINSMYMMFVHLKLPIVNIVNISLTFLTEPLCIIMEYAPNGNLQDLLRKQRSAFQMNNLNIGGHNDERHANLTARDLSIFALHIASGMDYIASKEVSWLIS